MGNAEVAAFENIFYEYFEDRLEELAMHGKKSIILDEEDIGKINITLMDYIIEQPKHAFKDAMVALNNIDLVSGKVKYFRIKKIEGRNISISNIRAEHIGKLWQFEGTVRKATDVYPLIVKSAWRCRKCGYINMIEEMSNPFSIPVRRTRPPIECESCRRKSVFEMVKEENVEMNIQRIEIQENLEESTQPKSIEVILFDDIAGKITPGDRVRVVGILDTDHIWRKVNAASSSLKYVVIAVYVETLEKTFEEIELTPDDIKEIENEAKDENIYEKLSRSIAPSIYGMDDVKEAILLQLFGGVPKVRKDGTRIRGDIHILLAGDPSTAKSQLLRYVVSLSPKGIYTVGGGGTYVGLTASVTKNEDFGGGKWVLEAGAMVLADGGLIAVDELDKMKTEERNALHSAMEQQVVVIDKAGIHATLKTRCPVLAGCNPKLGRFDDYTNDIEQIKLPPTLLSRFDLIFVLKDKPDEDRDRRMAKHILNIHTNDEYAQPILSNAFIRKYAAYAKRNVFPKLNKEASDAIENFYVKMRMLSTDKSVSITPRYLEALIRLAEASARVRLSNVAGVEDARRAIRIMSNTIEYLKNENGTVDIDRIEAIPSKKRDKYMIILQIIERIFKENANPVKIDDIVSEAEKEGIDKLITEKIIDDLKRNGTIAEQRYGEYIPV